MLSFYRPTATHWNRLEGRPRAEDFDRALRAEVRDALWMLSKQWQLGEFQGDDAGSAILAKVHWQATQLTKYQAGGQSQAFERDLPLEVKVEHQPIAFELAGQAMSLDIRLLMGRHWLKLVRSVDPGLVSQYLQVAEYAIAAPNPQQEADAPLTAHQQTWQAHAAAAGRCMDGYVLYQEIRGGASPAARITPGPHTAALDALGQSFVQWFHRLYYQPEATDNPSWQPSYLEHQFACSAPALGGSGEQVLRTDEYYHGHLDWYNLDIDQATPDLGAVPDAPSPQAVQQQTTLSFLPTPATFPGMPHTRWWTFEDWKTNLGGIQPDTTDLNKLLLIEFGLVYANDWFLLPITLPVGSLAQVQGLTVTNVFGERIWVEAAGRGSDQDWERWNMYSLSIRGDEEVAADLSLALLPAAPKVQESKPLEEFFLFRDEVANMVWGVETRVPLADGSSKPGAEAARELHERYQQLVPPGAPPAPLLPNEAKVRYQVVNQVPEHWIPFVPVRQPNDPNHRQIQLQRAAMPRILAGDSRVPRKVEPRSALLREGLDEGSPQPYFVHEEEVPRSGVQISRSFQRTRWCDGQVFTWVGIRKQTGRGQGHSGLAFDQLVPKA